MTLLSSHGRIASACAAFALLALAEIAAAEQGQKVLRNTY